MIGDLPTFAASNYASTAYNGIFDPIPDSYLQLKNDVKRVAKVSDLWNAARNQQIMETEEVSNSRRMVQVIIVDPNENIPLDNCLLYKGEPKLTDATDQELFFELDIKQLLAAHNDKRVLVVDKKVKDRTEYLEPAKVRDLKMVVVNIAQF